MGKNSPKLNNFRPGNGAGVRLAAVATATPPFTADQLLAEEFFVRRFSQHLGRRYLAMLKKFLTHPSIRQRHFAFDSPECLVEEDPDRRIARFTRWAVDLAALDAAFCDDATRDRLRGELVAWGAGIAELAPG